MPRRNLIAIFLIALISLICYQTIDQVRYGRPFVEILDIIHRRALHKVPKQELFDTAENGMRQRFDAFIRATKESTKGSSSDKKRSLSKQDLFNAAVQKMAHHVDNHSHYYTRAKKAKFLEGLNQQIVGIGVLLVPPEKSSKQLKVWRPLPDSPAEKAGIRRGDVILKIDGKDFDPKHFGLKAAVKRIKGEKGTSVRLTVLHKGKSVPDEISIVRDLVQMESVMGRTRNEDHSWNFFLQKHPHIAYVRIDQFGPRTSSELKAVLEKLPKENRQAILLDFRDNPGGLLDVAKEICEMFIEKDKTIVTTKGRATTKEPGGRILEKKVAADSTKYLEAPMAVLVDKNSASASEVVAACLQDHGRADIVGQRTFGKGSVQQLIDVEGRRAILKLTTASYWRPSNKNIHRHKGTSEQKDWGVRPDSGYKVILSDEAMSQLYWDFDIREHGQIEEDDGPQVKEPDKPFLDSQLERAVEAIERKLKQKTP